MVGSNLAEVRRESRRLTLTMFSYILLWLGFWLIFVQAWLSLILLLINIGLLIWAFILAKGRKILALVISLSLTLGVLLFALIVGIILSIS
ncbi:hypothetical protein [Streptococcus sobrinus]|nr:hypothetical protein [Streptococcus sobrinus]